MGLPLPMAGSLPNVGVPICMLAGVLYTMGLSNLFDFVKICIFDVVEPSGPSKSDLWLKNDSFWWGERFLTRKVCLLFIFRVHGGPLYNGCCRSQICPF